MSDELELRVVSVGGLVESTPEGLYAVDELRRRRDEALGRLKPEARAALEAAELELERDLLGL